MKPFCRFAMALVLAAPLTTASRTCAAEVRVTADHLNLRASSNAQAEVVGQVVRGDVLVAGETQGEWLQVAPPATIAMWVYGELIREGEAAVAQVLVRAGPGINYRDVGRLEKGDKVTVKGASASGEWLKIASPPGCFMWISAKYVESVVPRAGKEADTVPAAPQPVTTPPRPPAGTIKQKTASETAGEKPALALPPGLAAERLADRAGQGKTAQYEGVLGGAGLVWRRPSSYRLIKTDLKGHIVSACYVLGDESYLSTVKGKNLLVQGREYWVKGVAYPVVAVEQIVRRD